MSREFDFSKFVQDIEKKEADKKSRKAEYVENFKDHPIRKLNILTRELWQNRIKWRRN